MSEEQEERFFFTLLSVFWTKLKELNFFCCFQHYSQCSILMHQHEQDIQFLITREPFSCEGKDVVLRQFIIAGQSRYEFT